MTEERDPVSDTRLLTDDDAERVGVEETLRDAGVAAVRVVTDDVREADVAVERELPSATRLCAALREEEAVRPLAEACVRVADEVLVRILLLPKERDAALPSETLREAATLFLFEDRLPLAIAERVDVRRSTSKERALVTLRLALRVANERSG